VQRRVLIPNVKMTPTKPGQRNYAIKHMKDTNDLTAKAAATFGAAIHTLVTRKDDLTEAELKQVQHDYGCSRAFMDAAIFDATPEPPAASVSGYVGRQPPPVPEI
jgi:hypothetical protein